MNSKRMGSKGLRVAGGLGGRRGKRSSGFEGLWREEGSMGVWGPESVGFPESEQTD